MKTVAVVEDEADLLTAIREELEDEGFRVVTATTGAEGVDVIRKHRPDIILSDINMPNMNGFQMREVLTPEFSDTPFIFISAFANPTDIADGLLVGANHYVTKPIDYDQLIGWVRKLTR